VEMDFQAAHQLRGYEGKCARLHGHNYRLEVTIAGEQVNEQGLVMDFERLKAQVREVLEPFDHQHLNEIEPFAERPRAGPSPEAATTTSPGLRPADGGLNPTCENLARVLYERLAQRIKGEGVRVARVRLWETPNSAVTYWDPSAELRAG